MLFQRRPLVVAAAVLAILAFGCSKCGAKKAAPASSATRFIPAAVEAAVVVPDLGVLGERLVLLQSFKIANFAAQLQGFTDAKEFGDALVRQAGVDVRSAEELKKAGIAPSKGLAAALWEREGFIVVGVDDEKAFGETVKKLAQQRLGASVSSERDGVTVFSRAQGGKPELGYLFAEGFALVAAGETALKLPQFAKLPKESALSEDARWKASLSRLPKERDVLVYAPPGVPSQQRSSLVGLTASLHLSKEALEAHVDATWPDSQTTLAALDKKDGVDLLAQLPADAVLVARYLGDPLSLDSVWPLLVGPHLRRAFEEAKVDVKGMVLANLEPGAVMSLSVAPNIPLGAGMPELDVRRTNPFRYVQLVALARPKDPAKVQPLLEQMPLLAPKFGAKVEPLDKDGQKLFVTTYAQGEGVHFAQAKDGLVALASPLGRLEQELTQLAAKDQTGPVLLADPELKRALGQSALNVVVDLDRLRDAVRALPPEAWGIGGFAIKASALRWLDATDDLRAVVINAGKADTQVRADVALRFRQR